MRRLPIFPETPLPDVQKVHSLDKDPNCNLCELSQSNPEGKRCLPAEGEPGDILAVLDHPTEFERHLGRPAASQSGRWLRELIARIAPDRKVVYTYALGCKPAPGMDANDLVEPIGACRPYLHGILKDADPKVVLLFDGLAGLGFLGRSFQPLSVRKGFGWFFRHDEGGFMDPEPRPAFLLGDPSYAMRNKLIARALEEDLRAALLNPLPVFRGLDATYQEVRTEEDAVEAMEVLLRGPFTAMDSETSGMLHEPDFRVECVAVSNGEDTYVWGRDAIEVPSVVCALAAILEEQAQATWNGQYDLVAMECEPLIKGQQVSRRNRWILNLQSDSRIKRKLFEADAKADLGTAAELVGMGGHKTEAHTLITAIGTELRKLAMARHPTPTGRKRPEPELVHLKKRCVPDEWFEYLDQGFDEEKFAYRYLDTRILHRYCARDALTSFYLEEWCNDRLIENPNLHMVWDEVAQPAMWAWCCARLTGFPTDKKRVELLRDYLNVEIDKLGKKIQAHEPGLNPNSPQQVVKALEKRGFKSKRKTITGQAQMDKTTMEEFKGKHPLVDLILSWKMYKHTQDNFAEGLLPYIRSDGRVHPSFLQDGTECMPAGELVLTSTGYRKVEEVAPGELVMTHMGRWRPVTASNVFPVSRIYRVTTKTGLTLRTSGNHMYMTPGGWMRADELEPGVMVTTLMVGMAFTGRLGRPHRFYDSPIDKIEVLRSEVVYGLTVEEDESHVTGGIVTHNTGRPSSSDPNFFNRLKGRDEESRKLGTMLRECHAMPQGWTLLEADEGQIEIREVMDLCDDPVGIGIIQSGVDFHLASAKRFATVLGKDPEKVTDIDRERSKCFHPDTEVLTRQGWRRIFDLAHDPDWKSTEVVQAIPDRNGVVRLGWILPLQVFTKKHPSGKLIHLKNESIDLRVTPDHRMLEWTDRGYSKVVMPEAFGRSGYWASAGLLSQGGYCPSWLLRLAVATQADGSYTPAGIRFGFTRQRKIERFRKLLECAGWKIREYTSGQGVTTFYIPKEYAQQIKRCLDPDKTLPWDMLTLGEMSRQVILEEAEFWDGSTIKGGRSYHYSSSIEKNVDVLQAIAVTGSRKTRKMKTPTGWRLSVKDRAISKARNVQRTELEYTDEVACLSVPSTFVLVRDRGTVTVVGQTTNFAAIYELPEQLGFMLSKRLGISSKEGNDLATALFGSYTNLLPWMKSRLADCTQTGHSVTRWRGMEARHRPLWHLGLPPPNPSDREKSSDKTKWQNHARSSWNGEAQGSAVDIITSMIWPCQLWLDANTNGGQFLLQIYDSIMLMVRDEDVDKTIAYLQQLMTDNIPGRKVGYLQKVPLAIDVKKGRSWGQMTKVVLTSPK